MFRAPIIRTTAIAVALLAAGTGHAQDTSHAGQMASAAEALFMGWLTSRHLHQEAIDRGASEIEIAHLRAAADAAGAAYEAVMIAQNTVQSAASQQPAPSGTLMLTSAALEN